MITSDKIICGIYQILNTVNGKYYIGSSDNLQRRTGTHEYWLERNVHSNPHLQSAYNKYGKDSFKYIVLEECNKEDLLIREKYWIDKLNACNNGYGYNIVVHPNAPMKDRHHTEKVRKVLSDNHKGKKPYVMTDKIRENIRIGHLGQKAWNKGMCSNPEYKAYRLSRKGMPHGRKGWKHTSEARANISLNNWYSPHQHILKALNAGPY